MESNPLIRYPSPPNTLFESLRFDTRNSPSSIDNISVASPSYNSSIETRSSFERSSPSGGISFPLKEQVLPFWELGGTLMCPNGVEGGGREGVERAATNSLSENSGYRDESVQPSNRDLSSAQLLAAPVGSFGSFNLRQLLVSCAKALHEGEMEEFEKLKERARSAVSITGDPIQRLGAYMIEGLVARKESSGKNIFKTLKCREPESQEMLTNMQILYEICPYVKFGYMAANGAIAEACRTEDRIHIIDFQIAQGTQWLTLIQALAARPGGPPRIRLTGIDDVMSKFARGFGLEAVRKRLELVSENFKIPIEFHEIPVFAPEVTPAMLRVRPGEALVVNFPLQLHHTPDESVDVTNPRDGLLRMVKSLNPKIVTLVEQESNTNTTPFLTRFEETLDVYLAMFESIDVALPREQKQRIDVEQHCLARDIVNIIACEGRDREERHELFGKWKLRFTMAGFRQYPLSSYVNSVIGSLLRTYSDDYNLVERDGALLLGWKQRNLISASAWH